MKPEDAFRVDDLFSVKGKVALITGGSRGIGFMIARGFVSGGVKVYISSRKAEQCHEAAQQLSEIGECIPLPGDVSTAAGCARLAKEIADREKRLHILLNNAGAAWGEKLSEYSESGWDKVLNTNLKSVFFLTRDVLPLLEKAASADDPARIINIGSIDGIKVPFYETYAYPASKAAVHQLTRDLALKFAGKNITVNAIAPGPFESKMTEQMLERYREKFERSCPMRRIGQPADMAGIAIFLASRAGAYVNGTIVPVDGGITVT